MPSRSPLTNSMMVDFDFVATSSMETSIPKKGGPQAGAKIAPLLYKGCPIKIILGSLEQPVRVPFPIGTFDHNPAATRVNIVFEVHDPSFQEFSKG